MLIKENFRFCHRKCLKALIYKGSRGVTFLKRCDTFLSQNRTFVATIKICDEFAFSKTSQKRHRFHKISDFRVHNYHTIFT